MKLLVIETDKIIKNIEKIRIKTKSRIIAVVKANGYGLGLDGLVKILLAQGIDFFAVTELRDAIYIRQNLSETADILYMGTILCEENAEKIVMNSITAMISNENDAKLLNSTGEKFEVLAKAHIKINTGMNRYGFDNLNDVLNLKKYDKIEFLGIFTHFHSAMNRQAVDRQMTMFNKILSGCEKFNFQCVHVCNSYATMNYADLHFNTVRVGSAILGRVSGSYGLGKVGYIKTYISAINVLKKGESVGYRAGFTAKSDMKTAVLPLGSFDGLNITKNDDIFTPIEVLRSMYHKFKMLNKSLFVTVNGEKCRILGKIALNSTVFDITNIVCELGDEVTIDVNPLYVSSEIERFYV
ncbi:MAG: alanine racemase [Clostridia bacterium]